MLTETTIKFDTKKQARILTYGIVLAVACALLLWYILFLSDKIYIYYAAMFVMLFCVSVYLIFNGIRSITSNDKTGLILNTRGIDSRVTPTGKKLGIVFWADIDHLKIIQVYGSKFVAVVIKDKAKYLHSLNTLEQKQLNQTGVALNISNNELIISFDELYLLLNDYYLQYKS